MGRPRTTSHPFSHSAKARGQRRGPERQLSLRFFVNYQTLSNPDFDAMMSFAPFALIM
jgi:hypothetical protein